ncbi:MAG: hypothetical protein WC473_06060 [Patescibacteria group bacterium]|jgi:hypothetical protein
MSEWLHARKIEIANTGVFFQGTEYNLAKEGLNLKVEPHILEIIESQSNEPYQKIDVGATIEIKAVIEGVILRPADRNSVLDIIDNQDVSFCVLLSDNTEKYFFLSNCQVQKNWDLAFKGGEIGYVPITIKSTDASILQILIEETLWGEDDGLVPDHFELLTENNEILTGYILAI